ncbi:hypothetical protein [Oleiagrimonas soli]|uniref:General secretion pathway protein N n=1 Tax=Oleiagrimonas soli TaxID=1543381 RepID=A0A099D0V8_9GAMM|nr:hypothetical protein [Oleiagrimonas soli]KGI78925.1 hypothetical protein LF63_0101550 [Oleiagrimonas soli]MBB6184577.1 general secretion pathway protein N [Oleiagrimonas soli]
MNAADQRRLTPVFGVLCALGAGLLAALAMGLGRQVHWQAHGPAAKLPPTAAAARRAAPPLQSYATTWQKPLFTTDRKPAPESDSGTGNVTLGDLQLTGIILTPDLRMALMHDRSGKDVQVREGATIADSSWTLSKLSARSAVFTGNGQRTELKLKVAATIDANAGPGDPGDGGKAEASEVNPQKPDQPPPRTGPHGRALEFQRSPKGQQAQQAARDEAGQREKERRIQALKARIEARRRQMQAQQNQGQ